MNSTIYGVCRKYDRKYDYDWYKFTLSSPAKVNVQFSFNRADADETGACICTSMTAMAIARN